MEGPSVITDAMARGAALARADMKATAAADEQKAAESTKPTFDPGGLRWWGLPPADHRRKGTPRPRSTYRAARRNRARAAKWPVRRQITKAIKLINAKARSAK